MKNGKAPVPLRNGLNAGSYDALVSYEGDDSHAAGSVELTFTVAKAATATTAKAPRKTKAGTSATVKVKVTAPGLVPNGKVAILKGSKTLGPGTSEERHGEGQPEGAQERQEVQPGGQLPRRQELRSE